MMTKEQREAIRGRLAELEFANGGRLTPSAVVEDARDPESPLHSWFEWDVEKASMAYWLDQARSLITSVVVKIRTDKTTVRAIYYMRDPSAEQHEQGYVSIPTLSSDADMARAALAAEFSAVANLLRRARTQAAALDVQDEVETLLMSVVGLRNRIIEAPAQRQ